MILQLSVSNETNVSSNIAGKDKIILNVANNFNIKASNIKSDNITSINAGNINISNDHEHHELIEEFHQKDKGLFSSKTIDSHKHQKAENIINSSISSKNINLDSNKDISIKSSNILADNDINLKAKGNIYISSAQEKLFNQYEKQVKKSGIFSNGGLSITIGSQRQKDKYEQVDTIEKVSIIGSIDGTIDINTLANTEIKASDILAKKDINIKANNLDIINGYDNSINTQNHELKKSGLTLTLSNNMVDTASNFIHTINESNKVKDSRLNALLKYKAYDDVKKDIKKNGFNTQTKSLNLNISLGKEKYENKVILESKVSKNSNLVAENAITLTTKNEDINIKGSNILGTNIKLDSAKNINIQGSSNSILLNNENSAKIASLGITYDLIKNNISNININANRANNNINEENITYEPANIKANKLVNITSQKDLDIIDGKIEGDKIIADIQENLNIKSLQNIHNYTEDNKSAGLGIGLTAKGKYKNSMISLNKNDIDSEYTSVVNQAGIYAGNNGFNITVGDTTKLEGALLSSTTDKNILKTKNLIMEDLENVASYKFTSKGLTYLNDQAYKAAKKRLNQKTDSIINNKYLTNDEKIKIIKDLPKTDKNYANDLNYVNSMHNEIGLLPNILPGEEKENRSVTKSAIAPGKIEIENQIINISDINRDISNSLNKLDQIFNKQELKERQETAKLFSKYANEAIHNISEAMGWKDGSAEKVALHAAVGNLSMNIAKGNKITGMATGALSEILAPHILKLSDNNPTKAQWIAYVLGYATDKTLGGNGEQGGAVSQYGVKWNDVLVNENNRVDYINDTINFINQKSQDINITVLNLLGNAIKNNDIDIENMPGDYWYIGLSIGEGLKTFNVAGIVDKYGNAYASMAFSPGVAIGMPVFTGFGFLDHRNNYDSDSFKQNITGFYANFSANGVFASGGIGISESGFVGNVGTSANIGAEISIGKTWYIGSIYK